MLARLATLTNISQIPHNNRSKHVSYRDHVSCISQPMLATVRVLAKCQPISRLLTTTHLTPMLIMLTILAM